jgi:hypothetical protein
MGALLYEWVNDIAVFYILFNHSGGVRNMASSKIDKELKVTTKNEIGVLANVCTTLSKSRVNIEAICAYGMGDKGTFLIYSFDPDKALKALKDAGFMVTTEEVVVATLDNKVGAAELMTTMVAKAGVNVNYCYGSTGDGKNTLFIMNTDNNTKALKAIK